MNSLEMQTAAVLQRELNNSDRKDKEVIEWLEKRVAHYDKLKKEKNDQLPPP
tara:strand:+ start:1832 stop:1987 length:156 start_codon:yes stop_codon:yes gene_type:complete